jgi:hypothetical protein
MRLTVDLDQGDLDDLRERLAFIKGGWERAMVRAMNTAASQARTRMVVRARAILTADPERIDASLLVKKATYGDRSAKLHISGLPIPLFRFDVSFMYPTVAGGVTAKTLQGGSPLVLKHAFVTKVLSGSDDNPGPNHWGVFTRRGEKRRMTRGRYVGEMRQPIVEHFGPNIATVFEKTPGLEAEIMQLAADKFAAEAARQAEFLIQKSQGDGDG